jgi:hypothetical protein
MKDITIIEIVVSGVLLIISLYYLLRKPKKTIILEHQYFTFAGKITSKDKVEGAWYILEGQIEPKHPIYPKLAHIQFKISSGATHFTIDWDPLREVYEITDEDNVSYMGTHMLCE